MSNQLTTSGLARNYDKIAHIVLVEQAPQARLHIMLMVPMLAVGAYSLQ